MAEISATTSLTVSSERKFQAFGRWNDVRRIGSAAKSSPAEASRPGGELDLSTFGAKSRMVLQIMVAALFVGGCERVARSFACAKNQPTRMVERDSPSDPRHSRSIGPASRSARTISFGGCADDPSRAGLSGVRALAFAA